MTFHIIVFGSLLAAAGSAFAQTVLRPTVVIPREINLEKLGESQSSDRVVLQWVCGDSVPDTRVPLGTAITRQVTHGGNTIAYADTVKVFPNKAGQVSDVPTTIDGFEGRVYIDKNDARILRVNPFLWRKGMSLECAGGTRHMTPEELRDTEFFYVLKDRQSITLPARSWTFGAATIPLRYRRGYKAPNGAEIDADVSSKFAVGLYGGHSWGRIGYTYVQHGDNALKERGRITIGPFLALSEGSASGATSRSAPDTLTRTVKFTNTAPGLALLMNLQGLDAGLFVGKEYALGSRDARKWDYHGQWWLGLGLGYQILK